MTIGQLSSEFKREVSALLERNIGNALIIKTKKGDGYFISTSEDVTEACMEHFILDRFGVNQTQFEIILKMRPEELKEAVRQYKISKLKFELAQLENNL